MIPLTEDRKMLGYELMKAYPNISCFSTTTVDAAKVTMPPSTVHLTRETKPKLYAATRK